MWPARHFHFPPCSLSVCFAAGCVCVCMCACVHVYACVYICCMCVCRVYALCVSVCVHPHTSRSTGMHLPHHPEFVQLSPFPCGYSRVPTRLNVGCPVLPGLHDSRPLPWKASLQRQGGSGLAISTKSPFVQQGAEYIELLLTVVLGTVQGVEFPPRPTQDYLEIVCVALQSPA